MTKKPVEPEQLREPSGSFYHKVSDAVMCLAIVVCCFIGLFGDWVTQKVTLTTPQAGAATATLPVTLATLNTQNTVSLKDLTNYGSSTFYDDTRASAKAASAFLVLLLVCAVAVGSLAILWIVHPDKGAQYLIYTAIPLTIFGVLSLCLCRYCIAVFELASEDEAEALLVPGAKYKVSLIIEYGALFALLAGSLAFCQVLIKGSFFCYAL
eukprot:Sspe_Gene.78985::Locus_49483_Transcript_1_1_Confidence_1.000_Length_767::g.78985::m.78985